MCSLWKAYDFKLQIEVLKSTFFQKVKKLVKFMTDAQKFIEEER